MNWLKDEAATPMSYFLLSCQNTPKTIENKVVNIIKDPIINTHQVNNDRIIYLMSINNRILYDIYYFIFYY